MPARIAAGQSGITRSAKWVAAFNRPASSLRLSGVLTTR
jgi:hypothetical protein